jgi:hypothetical protein
LPRKSNRNYEQDWLPVEFWSTTPVYIEWSRSSHAGLNLTAEYKFAKDSFCGSHDMEKLEGEIHAGYSSNFSFALNHYYQQKCTYIIDSPANRELAIQIESSQTRKLSFSTKSHCCSIFRNAIFSWAIYTLRAGTRDDLLTSC